MLYRLNIDGDKSQYNKVKRVNLADIGWKEKDLEDLISNNIQDFISSNDLMTIFNERKGKEEPDILAVDKNGDLYIFELKRWAGKQENLLQVLRYGQLFGKSNYDDLNSIYKKYIGSNSNLITDHNSYFDCNLSEDSFNKKQHFIIVTNGLDQSTIESIIYWKSVGLSIDAVIYWVFEINKNYYIEFNTYSSVENYLEYENNYYVLNTDFSKHPDRHSNMIVNQKAAAFWPGYREKIQKLQKGDLVFLYQSGTGIVAYGYASGVLEKCCCDGHDDYEYNMKLNDFVVLKKPISAADMKQITNQGYNFRITMFSISKEASEMLLKEIKKTNK